MVDRYVSVDRGSLAADPTRAAEPAVSPASRVLYVELIPWCCEVMYPSPEDFSDEKRGSHAIVILISPTQLLT